MARYPEKENPMTKQNVIDASSARMNQRLRRRTSQELVAAAKKRGPAPGTGGAPPKENPKDYRLSIRFSKKDQDLIGNAVTRTGESLAEFVREAAVEKALQTTR